MLPPLHSGNQEYTSVCIDTSLICPSESYGYVEDEYLYTDVAKYNSYPDSYPDEIPISSPSDDSETASSHPLSSSRLSGPSKSDLNSDRDSDDPDDTSNYAGTSEHSYREMSVDRESSPESEYLPSPPSPRGKGKARKTLQQSSKKQRHFKLAANEAARAHRRRQVTRPPPLRNKLSRDPEKIRLVINKRLAKRLNYTCLECDWRQENERAADFYRHLQTHLPEGRFECRGVLLSELGDYDIPDEVSPYQLDNEWRIGGCQITFSRRDALRRHLQNPKSRCVAAPEDF